MKKLFISLLTIFSALSMSAEVVTRTQALEYARKFFDLDDASALSIDYMQGSSPAPSCYVINNRRGGFLLLSAESAVEPVLGYSFENNFKTDGMPSNLRAWLGNLDMNIKEVRARKLAPSADVQAQWRHERSAVKKVNAGTAVAIKSATWNQDAPYWNACMMSDGRYSYAGCVATAMSIVLRHNKYPVAGKGTLPAYTTGTRRYSIASYSIADHVYDWDGMPLDDADVKASSDAVAKITQLMHDCGVMVKMDYTPDGSGAYSTSVPAALRNYMGYGSSTLASKYSYSTANWFSLIARELYADRLVYYSAQDTDGSGGHAFVIDGYDGDSKFRVNWGWSGSSNGYYAIDLTVGSYHFADYHQAIVGLAPAPSSSKALYVSAEGLTLGAGSVYPGSTVTLEASLVNASTTAYSGFVTAAIANSKGVPRALISDPVTVNISGVGADGQGVTKTVSVVCTLPESFNFTDRVVLIGGSVLSSDAVIPYNAEVGVAGNIPVMNADFISISGTIASGKTISVELIRGSERIRNIQWLMDDKPVQPSSIRLTSGTHVIKAVLTKDSGMEVVSQEISVN